MDDTVERASARATVLAPEDTIVVHIKGSCERVQLSEFPTHSAP